MACVTRRNRAAPKAPVGRIVREDVRRTDPPRACRVKPGSPDTLYVPDFTRISTLNLNRFSCDALYVPDLPRISTLNLNRFSCDAL